MAARVGCAVARNVLAVQTDSYAANACASAALKDLAAMNFSIARSENGFYQLRIHGSNPNAHWVPMLCSSLAALQVSIVAARAERTEPSQWDAVFQLDFRASRVHPEVLNYVALTQPRTPPKVIPEAPQLQRFAILRRSDRGLRVVAEGAEQAGFLDRLLTKISGLGLYAVGLKITTGFGTVRANLVLRGIGGLAPTEEAAGALETLLRRMQVNSGEPVKTAPTVKDTVTQRSSA
jgi:hypothetical protein